MHSIGNTMPSSDVHTSKDVEILERVQRKATKVIQALENKLYDMMLRKLNLPRFLKRGFERILDHFQVLSLGNHT